MMLSLKVTVSGANIKNIKARFGVWLTKQQKKLDLILIHFAELQH